MTNEGEYLSLVNEIESVATVSAFRSIPLENFRNQLKTCFKAVFQKSRQRVDHKDQDLGLIDSETLYKELQAVPWYEICLFHDQLPHQTTGVVRHVDRASTPLQEVVGQLLDPCVVPRSCAAVVVGVLLEAILKSPRRPSAVGSNRNEPISASRWTSSQLFLLRSISSLWRVCPHLKVSFMAMVELLLGSPLHSTPHRWNKLMSIASYLAIDCPPSYPTMIAFTLTILRHVDRMDTDCLRSDTAKDNSTVSHSRRATQSECPSCRSNIVAFVTSTPRKRQRGVRVATIEDLHERDIAGSHYRPQYIQQHGQLRAGVSLKQVLSGKGGPRNDNQRPCQCRTSNAGNAIPDEWSIVRARGYRKFHLLFHQPPVWNDLVVTAISHRICDTIKFDVHRLLQTVHDDFRSPCLRLCLLLVSYNSLSSMQCHRVCRLAWSRFVSTNDPIWLRIYSENMATWSCFDNRDQCWTVLRPLVDFVKGIIDANDHDDTIDCEHNVPDGALQIPPATFRCLAHILSQRSNLLLQGYDAIRQEFQSFIGSLEIHCGEIGLWFTTREQRLLDNSNPELQTLQRLGILGFTSLFACDETENVNEIESKHGNDGSEEKTPLECLDDALLSWPFSQPFDLRSAHDRAGKDTKTWFIDWDKLLTSRNFNEDCAKWIESACKSQGDDYQSSGPPLTSYIDNPDLLLQVFQTLGYADIGNCRQVCKTWDSMIASSDCLWRELYLSHFLVPCADTRLQAATENKDWQRLCMQKVLMERSLCNRRNQQTGYKHRTCPYIGCLHIIKSERLESLHFVSHARQLASSRAPSQRGQKSTTGRSSRKRACPGIEKESMST